MGTENIGKKISGTRGGEGGGEQGENIKYWLKKYRLTCNIMK